MPAKFVRDWSHIFFAAIALGALPEVAGAQDQRLKRAVQAGRDVLLSGYARWNDDCSLREIGQVYLTKAPQHGIVCVRYGEVKIQLVFGGGRSACSGRSVRGVWVVYYANSGPAVVDDLRFAVRYTEVERSIEVTVNVRAGQRREALPKDLAEVPPGHTQPLERVAPCSPLTS